MRGMKSALVVFFVAVSAFAQSIDSMIDQQLPSLVETYKALHEQPELSLHEEQTSATLAAKMRALGYNVTDHVGGYGIVAVMKNGNGPTLLIRTDMDALPVSEQTGLPYASRNANVMHACGHDIHMASFIGTATMLSRMKDKWHGTLIMIGQSAEETVQGAAAMLRDGLYEKFGTPTYAIAFHDNSSLPAGQIAYHAGPFMAATDSVNIIVRGLGGHGARPELTKDPVVVASQLVLNLQTIVSREDSPLDPVVVTVGSIHGGTKRNIIPDQVQLLLTVRTFRPEVRKRVLASIERIAKLTALAAGIPEDHAPIVEHIDAESTGATFNDPALTERLAQTLKRAMGEQNVVPMEPMMVSEDFAKFALDGKVPICMLNVGAVDPAKIASGARLPSLHSSEFAPLPEPTIRGAVKAMTLSALELLR